jgi:methylmalonyl-CoA mutase, N-terminal domain
MKPAEQSVREWLDGVLSRALHKAPESRPNVTSLSGLPVSRVALPPAPDESYFKQLGLPGAYPFTRGIHPTMYRSRHWTMRQYAGFGSAAESNQLFRRLLAQGGTGLSVAFDLPTQIGLDSDHPLGRSEVGRVGVAIDSLADMEELFAGIPLDQVSTSMTINAPAAVLLAMYVAVAEKQGVGNEQIRGTVQNDILKEYLARGTYIFPPRPSLALAGELIAWCHRELPRFHPISISGYHIREAGSTAPQEIAFTFANALGYLEADAIAPHLSFFFNAASDFFEETAKFRAARRVWARLMKERYETRKPESMMLRFHAQTAGHTLTARQVDNNIARVTLQVLSAVLGGAQSIHANAKDEALSLPTPENAETALRIQQVIAHETGVVNSVDPLGGSYHLESLTDTMEAAVLGLLAQVEAAGGALRATENGLMQRWIEESAYQQQHAIESGERVIVGVNRFQSRPAEAVGTALPPARDFAAGQMERLAKLRGSRNAPKVRAGLQALTAAARAGTPLMPPILTAVRDYATIGEICDALRSVYGEYDPSQPPLPTP